MARDDSMSNITRGILFMDVQRAFDMLEHTLTSKPVRIVPGFLASAFMMALCPRAVAGSKRTR